MRLVLCIESRLSTAASHGSLAGLLKACTGKNGCQASSM